MIHQEFGSSETGTIALNLHEDPDLNIESVGTPLANVRVQVIKDRSQGTETIQVKSEGLSIGYLGEKPFLRDWYTTGDIAEIGENGYIYIKGRINRIINIGGMKVNPLEVEKCLLSHPSIKEVMVKGVPHSDFGEVIEALVVRKNTYLNEEELIKFCRSRIALFKVPQIIRFVNTLPKTGLGKTKYNNSEVIS
ncbi:hypothetical protein PACILC2_24620 [Paenibacillus cisolokensis]|uniref:AMP-binding enzyme C-terminal domain-containing protein n=1 Tax=Paenibacillus cisolokensis TaxID=1658519 RepID=A0ABQ4N6P5_9BACL|nr:fatty acid--CoA ligase family protein [Paenibacillus cisolokensis]GIQ63894.1 hypothetical protein PACILC2_24620 [Paenibacillus cisolokensis]